MKCAQLFSTAVCLLIHLEKLVINTVIYFKSFKTLRHVTKTFCALPFTFSHAPVSTDTPIKKPFFNGSGRLLSYLTT